MITNKTTPESITAVLARVNGGERDAFDELVPLVYQELHRIAEGYLRREWRNQTLQPTALIHEAYLKLTECDGTDYQSRKHFFAVAARVMRHILVDRARARSAAKRSASATVSLEWTVDLGLEREMAIIALDDALSALAGENPEKARMVEMRFFGGLTAEEIAQSTNSPVHMVRRDLRSAQAWLRREIEA